MKNLTRILAMVLVFSLMISSAAFAASFTDVEDGSAVAEATHVLSDLGILYGYEDGSFGPDKTITRAELVAVANRLQGLSDAAKAAGGVTAYTDVPADEWYAGDVNLATQMGVISGDGNGLFRPNDPVKYEEAVKMIVASLGYTQKYVDEKGGWPTGYLVIASEANVTKGLTNTAGTEAPRGIVARLAFNALTSPRMVLSSYASDGTAVYAPNTANILLDDKLGTFRLEGYVSENAISSVDGNGKTKDINEVTFVVNEKVGSTQDAFIYYDAEDKVNRYKNMTLLVGDTDAADNLALGAHAYVQENEDGDWEIVSFVVQTRKNVTAVIENTDDIQLADGSKYESHIADEYEDLYLSVFDEENDKTNTVYNLEDDAKVIVNGKYLAKAAEAKTGYDMHGVTVDTDSLGKYYAPNAGVVELLDNDNNGEYDYMFVTSYETVIVEEVFANNTKIATNVGTINLDFENKKGYYYSITLDGEEIEIADLQKNDVLSIAVTDLGENYEILVSRTTVEGTIDEMDADHGIYKVDGTEYELANVANEADIDIDGVQPGDEGILYIDAFGGIAFFDKTSATAKNFGFIVAAGHYESVGDVTYEVQILDKDGTVQTYTLADNVSVTEAGGDPDKLSAEALYAKIAALKDGSWILDSVEQNSGESDDDYATRLEDHLVACLDNYANRLITYRVNSSSKITAVTFADADANDEDGFNLNDQLPDAKYKANLGTLSNYFVTEDTVVFSLPVKKDSSKDNFEVTTIDTLGDGDSYYVAFYNADEDNSVGAIVIINNDATVGAGSSLAVVTKLMQAKNENAETVYNVTFLQGGEEKTLTTTSELYQDIYDAGFGRGDVFEYAVNAAGEMSEIAFGDDEGTMLIAEAAKTGFGVSYNDNAPSNQAQYVFGGVYAKTSGRVITIAEIADGAFGDKGTHKIDEDANVVIVDLTKNATSNAKVQLGAFGDIQAIYTRDGKIDADRDVSVLIKYYKDVVTDVIVYLGYADEYAGFGVID